jgi:hypothetical protein
MKRKVRQISQGIEDINWKCPAKLATPEKEVEVADSSSATVTDVIDPTTSLFVPIGKTREHEVFEVDKEETQFQTPPKTPGESDFLARFPISKASNLT